MQPSVSSCRVAVPPGAGGPGDVCPQCGVAYADRHTWDNPELPFRIVAQTCACVEGGGRWVQRWRERAPWD